MTTQNLSNTQFLKDISHFDEDFQKTWDYVLSKKDLNFLSRDLKCGRLAKEARRTSKRFDLQAEDEDESGIHSLLSKARAYMSPEVVSFLEDIFLTCAQILRSKTRQDLFLAVLTFVKLRTEGSVLLKGYDLIKTFLTELFPEGMSVQSADDVLEGISSFRSLLSKWEEMKDSTFVKKFCRLCNFLIGYGCFSFVGMDPTEQGPRLKDIGKNPMAHSNFLYCVVDTVTLTLQRCLIYLKTGEWDTFIHGPKTYGDWYDLCIRLKREMTGLGNLEAHGTNYFTFVSEVKSAIEQGTAIVKFHTAKDGAEFRAARTMLSDLQMINATLITKKSAQEERPAPFSLLVHGGSSVAKSAFVKMLYYYYAQVYNLPTGSEFKYTRNSSDKFWSGFATQAWCVLMDDIAYRSANSSVADISLDEMICVINNVPFNPPQGELADKGKTPLRAEFVIATTNAKNLNAEVHFHCPLAIQRRMPWVVTVVPKPQFCREDSPSMICPVKMMAAKSETSWPDYWQITVEKVVMAGALDDNGRQTAKHELIHEFTDVNLFLDWFKEVTQIFKAQQLSAMSDDDVMKNLLVCNTCNRTVCTCATVQSGIEVVRPAHVPEGGSWTAVDRHEDGYDVYTYEMVRGQYMVLTESVFRGVSRVGRVSPVTVVSACKVKMQVESVEYAEVLDIVLKRQVAQEPHLLNRATGNTIRFVVAAYLKWGWFRAIADKCIGNTYIRQMVLWAVKTYAPVVAFNRQVFAAIGGFAERVYMTPRWKVVIHGLVAFGALIVGYKTVVKTMEYFSPKSELCTEQGSRMSVTESHFKKDEKEAVWKNNRDHTTPLDVPLASLNPNTSPQLVEERILKNMARIRVRRSATAVRPGNMLCVGGHLWVTDNHLFEGEGPFETTIMFESEAEGVTSNRVITIYEGSLFRQVSEDRVWIWLPDVNVRANIHKLFASRSLGGVLRGRYIGLDKFVKPSCFEVHGLNRQDLSDDVTTLNPTASKIVYPYWAGRALEDTENGDCGKVLISTDPHCAIIGLHRLGGGNGFIRAVILTQDSFREARDHFSKPLIEPGFPKLGAEGVPKVLGPLHQKSPLRWLSQGSLMHYGSFEGYRRVPRSKVNYTLLGEKILDERKWDVQCGRPDLTTWAPWHHALTEITSQACKTDAGVLDHCIDAFAADIIAGLPEEAKAMLQKVPIINAINGVPGVAHLDKMNLATSMGEPWCTTKKKYLVDAPTETIPHAKIFTPEVMARISAIEEDYANGVCACPVFSGQKKDEARALSKLVDGKIRIFTGGPVDHTTVVRSYLHTFTKVMTEHKILFETGIGCAAQTLEWESLYDELVKHGLDRMVAGDYKAYDKKMGAMWMLGAFEVIIQVLKACGWTEEDCIPIYCIAEDTSHPFINLGGDLIRTYGMNPSGHSLTVIINSIVNSLYLRYAFAMRSPDKKCWSFKKFVALLTYGDDNVMGVSRSCDWFSHTTIYEEMAKIGVNYTMADKTSASVPFIHMNEISFLKRSWKWDPELNAMSCPLEMDSIKKMQVMCVEGKTLSQAQHQLEVFHSALGEYFFHGRYLFDTERSWMIKQCEGNMDVELDLKPFPTYDQLRERFWKNSNGVSTRRLGLFESEV